MSATLLRPVRDLRRTLWRGATGLAALGALPFRVRGGVIAPYYGGARSGDAGGPLIKVQTLSERFPQARVGYSLIYVLSNAIYVPQFVLDAVQRAGVPVVLNQNGVFYPAWYPHGWERENARMAAVHSSANHVFYQSDFCRRAAERFLGARAGRSEILYNAVDTVRFAPVASPAHGRRPFAVLVTGKIVASTAYRLTSAVEAVAAARREGLETVLNVAGLIEPSVEASARALAERLGIAAHVRFSGPYRWRDASDIYRAADAYLMTKHNDPCPNVVLEAMACGLPVLHLSSGGVPELVGAEAGVAIPVADTFDDVPAPRPEDLAQGLATIAAARERMAAAARSRAVARFDLAIWLDRHEAVFAELVARGAERIAA